MANSNQLSNAELFNCDSPVRPDLKNFNLALKLSTIGHMKIHQLRNSPNAGLYFCGERDKTKCFYCHGGLHNWSPADHPWYDHARWHRTCTFLLRCKGLDYVQSENSENPHQFWSLSRKLQLAIPAGVLLTRFVLLCICYWFLALVYPYLSFCVQ